jgi:hydrogenase expression/formation protein HypC
MCLAVPGQVQEIYEAHGTRMGKLNFGGVVKDVCLAYVPEVEIGDFAIVHVGVAISRIDEQSALETLKLLEETGLFDEELRPDPLTSRDVACDCEPSAGNATSSAAGPL